MPWAKSKRLLKPKHSYVINYNQSEVEWPSNNETQPSMKVDYRAVRVNGTGWHDKPFPQASCGLIKHKKI